MRRKSVQVRGDAKRNAIFEAAWDVFREEGYSNASMDEITRRTGGSKVSIYAHFGSKEALFEAVVRWRAEGVAGSYPTAHVSSLEVEKALTVLASAIVAGMTSPAVRDLHRVALSTPPGGVKVGNLLYEHGTFRVMRSVAEFLAARMTAGDLVKDDPMAAAEALFGLLLGTGYIRFALGVPERYTKAIKKKRVEQAVRIFLAAYRPTRNG